MRAALKVLLLTSVGAELLNLRCPPLKAVNHTGRNVTCVRFERSQRKRIEKAKRCLLNGVATHARTRRRSAMLQVGAHLAFSNPNDPFKRLALDVINRTVLVEPQPGVFRTLSDLVKAHSNPAHEVTVVNRAVSYRDEVVTFHTINDTLIDPATGCYRAAFRPPRHQKRCPAFFTSQIASLSLDNVMKHKRWIPNLEQLIVDVQVQASTVSTLLEEHGLRDDLVVLSVDAEGHDEIIIRSVDFSKIRPYFIVFEHIHVTQHAAKALGRVLEGGYDCLMETENHFCVRDRALYDTCLPGVAAEAAAAVRAKKRAATNARKVREREAVAAAEPPSVAIEREATVAVAAAATPAVAAPVVVAAVEPPPIAIERETATPVVATPLDDPPESPEADNPPDSPEAPHSARVVAAVVVIGVVVLSGVRPAIVSSWRLRR